jgi:hypothetical protein
MRDGITGRIAITNARAQGATEDLGAGPLEQF